MAATPPAETEDVCEPNLKRRKIRKGTHSCWACKRRKEKCVPGPSTAPGEGAVCLGCRRRGIRCVGQGYSEIPSGPADDAREVGERVGTVEALVEHLIKRLDGDSSTARLATPSPDGDANGYAGVTTLTSSFLESTSTLSPAAPSQVQRLPAYQDDVTQPALRGQDAVGNDRRSGTHDVRRPRSAPNAKHAKLVRTLHESLPSRHDIEIIQKASSGCFDVFSETLTLPYTALDNTGLRPSEDLLDIPGLHSHPVLVARHMLHLANVLQHLHPDIHEEIKRLSESPVAMMERLAETAISLVTTQDRLLGSIEGLESVMLESLYQANCGNVRLSWMASRKAMHLAQLMGLHRAGSRVQYQVLDPKTKADPRTMWLRILLFDRFLCLMLGLPQGSIDHSMATDAMLANDTPLGRLERLHCVIAARILERNESNLKIRDFALTQEIDRELQRAAKSLPSKWWLTPNLGNNVKHQRNLFWDVRHISVVMFHYNLLNQLHVPYMLLTSIDHRYEYSKHACVNASREVLTRYIVLRNSDRIAFSCRTADLLALMAAMTLLLAYLDSHRRSSAADNLLAHQYLSDRAMVEQVLENMQEVIRLEGDPLSVESARLLRQLLDIEAEAADGYTARAEAVSVHTRSTESAQHHDDDHSDNAAVRVHIPYFGVIKVAREGIISKEAPDAIQHRRVEARKGQVLSPPQTVGGSSGLPYVRASERLSSLPGNMDGGEQLPTMSRSELETNQSISSTFPPSINVEQNWQSAPEPQGGFTDEFLPDLTAGADDWTFQGIDLAFFDNLMRASGNDGSLGDGDWSTAWQSGGGGGA